MQVKAYKTPLVNPHDDLFTILDVLPKLTEKSVIAVTSKIISLCEGRVVSKTLDKLTLIKQEADAYLEESLYDICLTIKNNILIPSAGIDESNGQDIYILYPKDIQKSAQNIWKYLTEKNNLKNLGVIITDSHTTPLRRGVTGIGLGCYGFNPIRSYVGKPDCFGHALRVTHVNVVDALSVAAVFMMGEGNEQTPLAVITDVPSIEFGVFDNNVSISFEEDLYAPLLKKANWIKN